MTSWNLTITPYGTENEQTCGILKHLKPNDFEKSIDQGGHGGALRINRPIDGRYLFLKPKTPDGTEARNYKIINANRNIAKWMPTVFGEIKINDRSYLVMENIRKSEKGKELPQLVDIKLAGKIAGLYNSIASNKEMKLTRGQKKKTITQLWMRSVTAIAPGYLITDGGFRLFNYIQSKKILKNSLSNITTKNLKILLADLARLRDDIKKSGLAFIGASIALIHQENGSVKVVLIDPAHIQCSNKLRQQVVQVVGKQESYKVFYECLTRAGKNQYHLHKASNVVSLDSISSTIRSLLIRRSK